jgi:hypothetical protein
VCNVSSVFRWSAVEKCWWLRMGRVVTIPSLAFVWFNLSDGDVYVCIRRLFLCTHNWRCPREATRVSRMFAQESECRTLMSQRSKPYKYCDVPPDTNSLTVLKKRGKLMERGRKSMSENM